MGTTERDEEVNLLATVRAVLESGHVTPELEVKINKLVGSRESCDYDAVEREALGRLLKFLRERE